MLQQQFGDSASDRSDAPAAPVTRMGLVMVSSGAFT